MDRCAVLVDAGYLLGAAATLVAGEPDRSAIQVDLPGLVRALIDEAEERTGLPVLRVLWYDGAPNSQPLPEHRALRVLPDVKVRLGNLVRRGDRWQQKGVDSYLQRDLATLSRNRAVADVVLVGGDEDLRRSLGEAQDYGVRVHLWGVAAATPEYNQSQTLIAEADRRWVLPAEWVERFVHLMARDHLRQTPEQIGAEGRPGTDSAEMVETAAGDNAPSPSEVARIVTTHTPHLRSSDVDASPPWPAHRDNGHRWPRLRDLTTQAQAWSDNEQDATSGTGVPEDIGRTFALRWASRAAPDQVSSLALQQPKLPRNLDGELLRYADRFGIDTWEDESAKFAIRGAFWEALTDHVASGGAAAAPAPESTPDDDAPPEDGAIPKDGAAPEAAPEAGPMPEADDDEPINSGPAVS